MVSILEDFGRGTPVSPSLRSAPAANDRYDEGYNAGWDDAMAQVEAEQSRIGAQLAERLGDLGREQAEARAALVADLEPAIREVFDKVLPHAVDRAFLADLMEEVRAALEAANEEVRILVSPEDVAPLTRLLDRAGISEREATVTAEPALAMSQALLRWTGQERRIDLDGVLTQLDAAVDAFFETLDRGQNAAETKEAQNA